MTRKSKRGGNCSSASGFSVSEHSMADLFNSGGSSRRQGGRLPVVTITPQRILPDIGILEQEKTAHLITRPLK